MTIAKCEFCKRPIDASDAHVRQAKLDLEGRWKRPHYDSYHRVCFDALAVESARRAEQTH